MHWTNKYLSIEYKDMNCSKFVEHVLRDHFGIDYTFPQSRGSVFEQSNLIKKSIPEFSVETNEPKEGDLVLMHGIRRLCHVGMFVKIKRESFVLHTESKIKAAALHRIKDLSRYGYSLGGFYTWLK